MAFPSPKAAPGRKPRRAKQAKRRDRTQELAALYATFATLVSSDPAEVLQSAVKQLKSATAADAAIIRILDPKTEAFTHIAQIGFSPAALRSRRQLNDSSDVSAALRSGEPMIVADIATDTRLKGKKQLSQGYRSCAFLPIMVAGKLRGLIHLVSRAPGRFSEAEKENLTAIARQMGAALENRELFEQTQKLAAEVETRYGELRRLHELSQAVLSSPDMSSTLSAALQKVLASPRLDVANIRLFDGTGRLEHSAHLGYLNAGNTTPHHFDSSNSGHAIFVPRVMASRQSVIVNDIASVEGLRSFKREGVRSAIVIPIATDTETLGVIEVGSRTPRAFRAEEVRLLEAMGAQLGVAVQKARLFERLRTSAQEQAALSAVAAAASRSLETAPMLGEALAKVLEITGRKRGSIRIKDPITGQVELAAQRGFSPDEVEEIVRRTSSQMVAEVLSTGKAVVIDDVALRPVERPLLDDVRSVAWIPIIGRDSVIGVLAVSGELPRPFERRELDFLEAIGRVIGVALQNSWLYVESQRQKEVQQLLKELSQDITALDLATLFQKITDKVRVFFNVDISDIRLLDEGGARRVVGASGTDASDLYQLGGIRGRTAWIVEHRCPLVIADATNDKSIPAGQALERLGIRGYAAAPLFSRSGDVIGILRALSYETRPFSEAEVDLLQQLANGTAIAIENARLFEETNASYKEIQSLHEIAQVVLGALDLNTMAQQILEKVARLSGFDFGTVMVINETKRETIAHLGYRYRVQTEGRSQITEHRFRMIGQKQIVMIEDVPSAEGLRTLKREGVQSAILVPLCAENEIFGALQVGSRTSRKFEDRELQIVQGVANLLGIGLQKSRLFKQTEQRAHEQATLSAIATATSQSLHIDEVLAIALDKVLQATGRERGYIRLKHPVTQEVTLAAHRGLSDRYVQQLIDRRTVQGKVLQVFETGEPLVVNDEKLLNHLSRAEGTRSTVWVPLKAQGNIVGILNVATALAIPFEPNEVSLLQAIGNVVGVAVENARLYEESKRQEQIQTLLKELSQDISALDIDSLLKKLTDNVREFFKVDIADVRVIGGDFEILGISGIDPERMRSASRGAGGGSTWVVEHRRALILPDLEQVANPPIGQTSRRMGVKSYVAIPLFGRSGSVIGVLRALSYRPRNIVQSEIDLLQQLANGAAIAIENSRLLAETKRRQEEQAAINAIAMATTESLHVDELLKIALAKVLEVTGRKRGSIKLKDPATGKIMLAAHQGISEEYARTIRSHLAPEETASQIFESGEVVMVNDPEKNLFNSSDHEAGLRSLIWVPLKARGAVIGILNVSTQQSEPFSAREVELLKSIGHVIGIAVQNARLFRETDRHLKRLQALREIDQAISSTLDLENVLNILLEKIDVTLPYASATIRLIDRRTGLLEPVACRNLDEAEWKGNRTGRGIPNVVFATQAPVVIRDVRTDARASDLEFYHKHKLVSYVGVPLIVKQEIIGVLGFYTKEEHDFEIEEINFLATLAGQAAIAIQNSQLYEEARLREQQLEDSNRMLSALHAAAAAVSRSLDLDRVLKAAIEKVNDIFRLDAVRIHIYDKESDVLVLRASLESGARDASARQAFRRGEGVTGAVAESGEPLIFEDAQSDPRYPTFSKKRSAAARGYRFMGIFPIKGKRRVLGTLSCIAADARRLTASEITLIEALADQLAVAIENSQLYDELKQKVAELQRANKVKDEFLSVMSHELRTPLNVVIGYAGLLREGMLGVTSPEQNKALDKLVSRTSDLLSMITSILYAASIDANEVRVEKDQFALGEFLDDVKRGYVGRLGKPVELEWDYAPDLPVVFSDRDKVKCIVRNLIGNAIKFTNAGRVTVSARALQAKRSEPARRANAPAAVWMEFTVSDTGIGIAEEKLPIIFDKFRQADSSETRQYGGVGLGLYIAKRFAELLGGNITVETALGRGSTFTVKLPCRNNFDLTTIEVSGADAARRLEAPPAENDSWMKA
jgi:GAF domain-containing protein